MTGRSAVDTIRGYFYQFDYSILRVLKLSDPDASIAVECIEDVDICTATETSAVQCKYYAGTEYNHSVIKPAVMKMLSHFKGCAAEKKSSIKYSLRGHYNTGQHKLNFPINVDFLKQRLLTYRKNQVEHRHHEELDLNDTDLAQFLAVLDIDINAASFESQFEEVIQHLQTEYKCTPFTAEYFYYNSSLALIRSLSTRTISTERTITKRSFLEQIDNSSLLFNEWFVKKQGENAHFAALRKEYFSSVNISPFERFFLIEIDPGTLVRSELKDLLFTLSKKWSKTSKRDGDSSFCPYIYIHGISAVDLVTLKKELANEDFGFVDGYDFLGAEFNAKSISRRATHENGIKLKVLTSIADLTATVGAVTKTRKIYQFYLGQFYFGLTDQAIEHVKIQVKKFTDIKKIV